MADQVDNLDILAWCLLDAVPSATCIEIWAYGRPMTETPDAVARPPKAENAPAPTDLVLDIATAILLAKDQADNQQTGAPSWLTRQRCTPRPEVLRGRAIGNTPPV
jgi:hypothetical protein